MVKIFWTSGLWEGTRNSSVRLMDVQSNTNWVRIAGGLEFKILQDCWTCSTVFISSGWSLCLVSARAGQTARICSIVSCLAVHSLQDGSRLGLSLWRLCQVRKSPDKNLRCMRSFLQSRVVFKLQSNFYKRPCVCVTDFVCIFCHRFFAWWLANGDVFWFLIGMATVQPRTFQNIRGCVNLYTFTFLPHG